MKEDVDNVRRNIQTVQVGGQGKGEGGKKKNETKIVGIMSCCTKVILGLCLHCRTHRARQRSIQIQALDRATILAAFPEEVGEILGGNIAFLFDFGNFLLPSAEILDVLR